MRSHMSRTLSPPFLRGQEQPVPHLNPTRLWPRNTHLCQTEPQTLWGSHALLPGVKLGAQSRQTSW